MCTQESETFKEREKVERERIEHIFGKKDSVGTWGEQARVGFREEEEAVCACLRMIIDAVRGRKRDGGIMSMERGMKRSSQIFLRFWSETGSLGRVRALRKR